MTFGGIDYVAQIEALLPYMANSIAIFYDSSAVGSQLKATTEEVFLAHKSEKKKVSSYPVNLKGDNIIAHLSKPSAFNKASIILHIPVVKTAILTSQLTFIGIKEHNILSTQINIDPNLLTLTQYGDRKNMIFANSLIEFPAAIYESNALMNNDISFDWIQYSTSIGIDYLVSILTNTPREYTMRLINAQVIYPVELLRAKESGFESLTSH
jgi:SRSO17 transposase